MIHERVLSLAMEWPWAILPEKLAAIEAVLLRRERGERYSAEQIEAVIGERKEQREAFCLTAARERIQFAAAISAASGNGNMPMKRKMIAVLPVYGIIGPKAAAFNDASGPGGCGIDKLTSQFRQAVANDDVKCIVMDFDSPGGSIFGVDEFASEIFEARSQKKIIAQVNPVCASAAYYLASQCSEIAVMPTGWTGSIGVFMMHADFSEALKQDGIKVTHIAAGKYKTEGNQYEPLSPEGQEYLQKRVDECYDMFVKAVARGRGVKSADVRTGFGQGRVVGAVDAKSMGMIDRIATLDETLQRLGGNVAESQPMMAVSQTSVTTAEADKQEVLAMSTVATPAAAAANVEQLRALLGAEAERVDALTALAREHNMTDKLSGWIKDGTAVATAQGEVLNQLRTSARPIQTAAGDGSGILVVKDVEDKTHASVRVARMARMLGACKGDKRAAAQLSERLGDKVVASAFMATAPQNASNVSQGGAFIPENWVPDLIEYLRPAAVFRSLNPTAYPLVNGSLSLPKLSAGGSASYVGELGPIPSSNASTATVKGAAKKLAALIPISNDLIRFAGLSVDAALRDDMMAAIGQAEDGAFIRGAGSQYSPKGLRYQALAANVNASSILKAKIDTPDSTTSVLTAVVNDLSNMLKRMATANVRFRRPGWIMSRRTEFFLMYQVRDGIGNMVFRDEMQNGKLLGYPYKATTVIPNNLGTSTYDSEIYLADFADVIVADAPTIAIEVSNEASYVDGAGVTHNAFQEDSTLIRFIEEHDLMVRHEESIQVLTTVQYGS